MFERITCRKRRLAWISAGLAVTGLTAAGGIAVAGGSAPAVYVPQVGVTLPAEKAAALDRQAPAGGAAEASPAVPDRADPIPARMLGPEVPVPISPSVLRATNGWVVSDGQTLTAVYAGAAGDDTGVGRLVVVRQDLIAGQQTVDKVDVGKTGPLTIMSAPEGAAVEAAAQHGRLVFESAQGATGTISLDDDAVQLDAP